MKFLLAMLLSLFVAMPVAAAGDAPEVYFLTPEDGATVTSPVRVVFGLRGMGVAPAGMDKDNTGHHHLIIDAPLPPAGQPIPSDEHHLHFGGGQTETLLELSPGKHTLQLVVGDYLHRPHDAPVVSKKITITVKPKDK